MSRRAACVLACAVLAAALAVATGCGSPQPEGAPSSQSPATLSSPADVAALAARCGLHPVSESNSLLRRLPHDLEASSEWGLVQHASLRAGYDLQPFAGRSVQLSAYTLTEQVEGEPLTLWVVRGKGEIVGAYVTDEVSDPGVYAVDEL